MNCLSGNLRFLRKKAGMTQGQLAEKIGVQRSMISAYEDGRSDPKLAALEVMATVFDIVIDELLFWDIERKGRKYLQQHKLKILTVTLDEQEEEWISMVGAKASAGYLNGYADPEYMENLPNFRLPNLSRDKTYRAFEISGDSMLPLTPGTLIIGSYLEHGMEVKNGRTYVLVTKNEGIVYKRVFNYITEQGKLFVVSDNDRYKPYNIPIEEVLEIWEAKAFVSADFPDPSSGTLTIEDLGKMIREVQKDIRKISGK